MFFNSAKEETQPLPMNGKPRNHQTTQLYSQPSDSLSLPMTVNSINSNTTSMTRFLSRFRNRTRSEATNNQSQTCPSHESRQGISRHPLRFSSGRRASAALLSIFVCSTTLFYMVNLFSTKLHTFESELAHRDDQLDGSISALTLFHTAPDISLGRHLHSGRRLASTQAALAQQQFRRRYPERVIDNLRQTVASMRLIFSFLKHPNREKAFTAFFAPQIAYASPSTAISRMNDDGDGYTTVISVYHISNGRSERPVRSSLSGSLNKQMRQNPRPSMEEATLSSIRPRNTQHVLKPRQIPSNAVHADTTNRLRNEALISTLKPTGLKKAEEFSASATVSQRSKELNKLIQPVSHQPEGRAEGADLLNKQELNVLRGPKTTSLSEDMIEIWLLRSGNSVCRIYNVGRLTEGRLVLPEWMKRHSMFLLHQCGVKDPVFAIKSRSNSSQFAFNKKRLNMTGWVRVVNNANMDLVETNTPRHHMPHFASDIMFPLRAMELLKGSGNSIAKLSSLRRRSSPNSPDATTAVFPDLKPSMFLSEATWEASPSTWVRRLAKFFSHPEVKVSLLSEKVARRPSRRFMNNKNNLIWRFRSVLSSNLNPYEREGLFDTNGNNLVFSRNGLSGAPALTIKGISQEPCRVSVTALTRIGPRALLHLDVLKEEATALFRRGRLDLDFKTVKFENAGFDTQVKTMRETNVLIATHGAGNTNVIFMRRGATFVEVFPFAYRAGPFESLARTFGLEYKAAMSTPQTNVFKECMNLHESNNDTRKRVFEWWDKAVAREKKSPWVHRLELEKEFGEPGKSEGMATRQCARRQQLAFDTKTVAAMAFESAMRQCNDFRFRSRAIRLG